MRYIKFRCPEPVELPTVSGVDQNFRYENYGVWVAEDEFSFPEATITSNMCLRKSLVFKQMTDQEIKFYSTTVSG
jgi:hypothetical protein